MSDTKQRGKSSLYRLEDGVPCIDVKVDTVEALFDTRDPAPMIRRDLDPNLVEFLRDSAEDLQGHRRLRVVFWVEMPCPEQQVKDAYRVQFEYVLERVRRRSREHRRTGLVTLLVAVLLLVALQALARVLPPVFPHALEMGVREGLLILGWVLMWRPAEMLLFDWIPAWYDAKVVTKLLNAQIEVRFGPHRDLPAIPRAASEASKPRE